MALTAEQVARIAHLARLQLPADEQQRVTDSLNSILGLIDQLQAADTTGIAPMAHPVDATQALRADEVTESDRRDDYQRIAPAVQDGCYLVPRVVE
ncbi:Asp-tRNA(Asn)/Glu-tRNA(Gln) amidotransferase subunit GatC [Amnimonas aquatica]|uniref:Aspartyl/glutamyl-tRNA(Asn/Gln) amidotransferase subunit C n=1 Tax=Amnimonas aquatica TaxID=2094561 RepID=A0A2P6ASJ4_9GAMM|nr:Asp-tRNA(Asn)/Glu-tRNA(Gln) amidotransferase subunit GatC [Amnimonas aquatica]PQA43161.1 Asp-tRNA(Asn)/Glu-tRNA(Gln) amidotransferase GatCAB subunit C [Amnimonas aquatica]